MLRVTNNGSFDLNDRYGGVDFSFPVGKSITIGDDAARHIFGIGEADKTPFLVRLGWMRTNLDYDSGMQKLNAFVFSAGDSPDPNEIQNPVEDDEQIEPEETPSAEQGLAPLHLGPDEEASTDGDVESSVPLPPIGKGRSILDQLSGA